MMIVRDRERDLGHSHLTQAIPAGHRYHLSAEAADQGKPIDTRRPRLGAGDGVRTSEAVEAKEPALLREVIVERLDVAEILRGGSPQA